MLASYAEGTMLDARGDALLEDLALALRGLAKPPGGHACGTMEGAHEVGQVVEAGIECDVGDGAPVLRQQACGMPQTRTDEILMRRNTEHAAEQPQEVERAQ